MGYFVSNYNIDVNNELHCLVPINVITNNPELPVFAHLSTNIMDYQAWICSCGHWVQQFDLNMIPITCMWMCMCITYHIHYILFILL